MTEPNVVTALSKVLAELPGIGKGKQASAQQGGYAYRGIEQITKEVAPLFAKHGIVFVPQVQACDVREITVNGKPWTDTTLTVGYRICGPGGPDDYVEAAVVGVGRDNADKGANKALTQAFKYALTQVLCIADAKDDNDAENPERDASPHPRGQKPPPVPWTLRPDVVELGEQVKSLNAMQKTIFDRWRKEQEFLSPWTELAVAQMSDKIDELVSGVGANLENRESTEPSSDVSSDPTPKKSPAQRLRDELGGVVVDETEAF